MAQVLGSRGAQVQARLHALQDEWDRIGPFDESHMKTLLEKLDAADPGHMRPKVQYM
jgi:hypothetical protein